MAAEASGGKIAARLDRFGRGNSPASICANCSGDT